MTFRDHKIKLNIVYTELIKPPIEDFKQDQSIKQKTLAHIAIAI